MQSPVNSTETTAPHFNQLAEVHLSQGKLEDAIIALEQALKLQPDYAPAYKTLGNIFQAQGRFDEAVQLYAQALQIDPEFAEVLANLGSISAQQQNWEDALAYYQKAIAIKPTFSGFYRNLARLFSQLGKEEEAALNWYQAYTLESDKTTAEDHFNLGNTLLTQEKLDLAIACFRRALQFKPDLAGAYQGIGEALKRQGKLDEAVGYYRKAVEIKINGKGNQGEDTLFHRSAKSNPPVNLALNKPTAQSSVFDPEIYGYNAHGACNSKKTGGFGFCTFKDNQPWWQIDLQGTHQLSEIKIYNRMDCCQERASTLNILLSQDALNWELCYSNSKENLFGGIDGKPLTVNVQHRVARFVRLQLRENEYLHLDEVEIYGIPFSGDGSELKCSQDEATLSANFYGQDNLPSAPPIIKGVVVRRGDGLGTRLMSILSARYTCEYFGCNMYVSWIRALCKYYPSNILNADSIVEIFEGGKIFKDIDVPLLNEEDFFKLNTKRLLEIEREQGWRMNGVFFSLSKKQTENLSQLEFINWELPWSIVPYGNTVKEVSLKIKDDWKKINWNHSIINQIQKFQKQVSSKSYLVVHIRRGDIIQMLLSDDIPTLDQHMPAIFGRFLPIKMAVEFVLDSGFKDVVVCSECHNSTQIFVDEVKRKNHAINFYITSEFTQSLSATQAAAYDLIIMSDSAKVLTSFGSTFSTCAEFAGNTHRAKTHEDWDNTDWDNMANELIAYLDNNDNERTNERKSLVYLYLSKYVKDQDIAEQYITLSQQHLIMQHLNLNSNNLALNKPTAQSSVFQPENYGYDPQGACNGNKNGGFGFCTIKENQPWWQIDLQGTHQLSEIKIYNRINFEERASTLDVLLSEDALNWELCYSNDQENLFGGIDGKPLTVDVQHQVARFVRLQLRENEYLHLDEVEIYGIPVTPDSSELKSNQDEATLSANFYGQAGQPHSPLEPLETFNFIDYKSQLLQDKWVVMMTKGKQKGVFLEIGSTDGVTINNTFCLEKQFSWSGICVEPNPDYFKKLCVNRSAINLPYVFYKESGQIVEFVHHGELGTISDFVSTDLHAANREKFVSEKGTLKLITARPEDILNLYEFPENFDFLSLDVEGAELDVLESFNLSKFHPALACVEHNHVADRRLAIFELLYSYGYQRIQCKFDDWYYNLDILQVLNPEIPLGHYQQVLEYFCNYHDCELDNTKSLVKEKTTSKDSININIINPNPPVNLALNKPTAQSSVFDPEIYGYNAHGACNSNKTGGFGFCTFKENQPWWQIDLQGTHQLSEIKIYNRMDCCQERASTLNILLSQDALNWELCYSNSKENLFGGIDGKPLTVNVQHQVARFVRLQLRENEYLHLDEVEIYGIPVKPNSSEWESSQDEATLSANFYAQASLPPQTTKQIAIKSSKGIIHVGANKGQEADFYAIHDKSIIWIEALPQIFQMLETKVANYPNQQAINALVTDTDGEEYKFYISNNTDAVSSSVFEFGDGKDELFPQLKMVDSVRLVGKTLSTIYREFNIDGSEFDFLLLDVQGAELMVLKGAESVLHNFKYILTEISTVNVYKNGVLWDELKAFLNDKGFKEVISGTPGKHCDVLFVNSMKSIPTDYNFNLVKILYG